MFLVDLYVKVRWAVMVENLGVLSFDVIKHLVMLATTSVFLGSLHW